MKKILLIIFFIITITSVTYASENCNSLLQSEEQITFDDAKKLNEGIMLLDDDVAESELYYDQLTEIEKTFYNNLSSDITTFIDTNEDGYDDSETTYQTVILEELPVVAGLDVNTSDGLTELWASAKESIYNLYGIDITTLIFRPIYALTYFDQPQYFWLDINKISGYYGGYSYNSQTGVLYNFYIVFKVKTTENNVSTGYTNFFPDCYTDRAEVASDYNAMLAKANEIISSVPEGSTDWGKLNYYMNWFKDNCQYNQYLSSGTASTYAYLPVSALLYGKDGVNAPVCEGYSEALKILCNMSGIKSMCTETYYTLNNTTTGHKWNLVNIDGKFYHCDPTWFDSYSTINSYRYFLTGSTNMASYDTKNHTILYQMDFNAPEISSTDYLNDIGINGYSILNIDGNTLIDKADTVKLLRIVSNTSNSTGKDVNGDGKININDVIKMQQLMFK